MIVLSGCKPPALRSDKRPVEEPVKKQYPLSRVITNAEGRSIPGEIVGKRGDDIAFRRSSDGQRFVVSLTQLSPDDQLDLGALPDGSAEAVAALLAEQTAAAPAATAPRPLSGRARDPDGPNGTMIRKKPLPKG